MNRRRLLREAAAIAAFTLSGWRAFAEEAVMTRRFYMPSPWGQLHIHEARPGDGSRGTKPALICFHQTSGSGKLYVPFLPYLATDRVVMAVDTPGYGASDGPADEASIEDYASAIAAALDSLGYGNGKNGPLDVLGLLTGSMIAGELTLSRPDLVRRLVLAQSPMLNADERTMMHDTMVEMLDANWREKGAGYYQDRLSRTLGALGPDDSSELAMEAYVETVLPGRAFMKGELAAMRYPAIDLFTGIERPTLILSLGPDLKDKVMRGVDVVPKAILIEEPDLDRRMFRRDPAKLAPIFRDYLDS
jgi:pimeloyl-ACP methyl ester carboxylesterase